MLNVFLRLLLSAYGVTLFSVPIMTLADLPGAASRPLVAGFLDRTAFMAINAAPYALAGAGMALALYWVGVRWWHKRSGRLLFVLLCVGIGGAQLKLTFDGLVVIGAAAAGTAAWIATWPDAPLLHRFGLVVVAGLGAGVLQALLPL
ncbi:MAG TPA: hypothetical protein VD973_14005 [Symbiobacteriaceae bacterium]|nr:hypothetical protein [Symbiobacteriaceae bacterium]